MKTLYESIIGSNNASIFGTIKNLILNGKTEKESAELQKLWDKAGLGIEGCYWTVGPFRNTNYVCDSTTLICTYELHGWDIEITDPKYPYLPPNGEEKIEEIIKKLESSGHFVINKSHKESNHILAKIK